MRFRRLLTPKYLLIAGATLALAYAAAASAVVNVLHSRLPNAALKWDEDDPVALVRSAQVALATGEGAESPSEIMAIARRSVTASPINAPAFRLYGLVSTSERQAQQVSAQMIMANRLSRRDLGTQLFLIEYAVSRNDVRAALRHYDNALRSDESSRALLFPILTAALGKPVIRKRFLPYLAAPPPWLESFLRYAVSNSAEPAALAELAISAGGFPEGDAYSSLDTELLSVLVRDQRYGTAVRYFRSLERADKKLLTTFAMTNASTDQSFAPVSWQPFSISGVDAIFVTSEGEGLELEAVLESGFTGPVVQKLAALPAGSYSLNASARAEDFTPDDTLQWRIACVKRDGGRTLFDVSRSLADRFDLQGTFTVPADCPVQMVTVSARTRITSSTVKLTLGSPELLRRP